MNNSIQNMNKTIQNEKITVINLVILDLLSKTPFRIFTIDEIKENLIKINLKTNYATVYRNVDYLVKQGILLKEKYGMASRIQINCSSEKITSLLSLIEIKKFETFFGNLKGFLLTTVREITSDVRGINDFRSVLIFGSYAKGTQYKNSDLDLIIIYDVPDVIKKWGEEQKENYIKDTKRGITSIIKTSQFRGGSNINPIIISRDEHKEMIFNNEDNVAKETLLNHIILKGYHEYWLDVLNSK